jgi:hypothetical protein
VPQGRYVVFVEKKNNLSGQGFETRIVQLRHYTDYPIAAPNYRETSEQCITKDVKGDDITEPDTLSSSEPLRSH